ncbi:hypothetical protein ARAM_004639 [Aspergillus rambellii]|uniref:phosphoinositide 5-phosphatase n=1 Tax=Aspergillus rambellii TaxID=308745 RepID=A0A0F8WV40_9EURO|nr:hypothetical protein ARAM_004639 [Aspergillus rambellii]
MPSIRVLSRDHPERSLVLATSDDVLIFRYSLGESGPEEYRCLVEFASLSSTDLTGYKTLGHGYGTLGLITLEQDIFLCIVSRSLEAATVRPGETVQRIEDVDFYCLNRSEYEYRLDYELESSTAVDEYSSASGLEPKSGSAEHPFLALKKLLSDGSFYYSLDFNLTDRLQDRSDKTTAFDIESLDKDVLWNSYMIEPLLVFRSQLSPHEKLHLDSCQILTCVIRGFCGTLTIPASVRILNSLQTNLPSMLTLISRQSSRRAGTRFNARGIDDDGNVANFVETETILWVSPGLAFSYVQVRGSVPVFWEQATGFLPGQQKIEVTRSIEATQHAFDRHFEALELEYGAVHIVNLLSELKSGEFELSTRFREHVRRSPLRHRGESKKSSDHDLLRMTEFDLNAEARGPLGYGAGSEIKHELVHSLHGFAYFLSEKLNGGNRTAPGSSSVILQQEGVFRTNCLDCLDRTNLVQTIISSMALESFLLQESGTLSSEINLKHSTLWADNGDALSKIYAGTGALRSSYTRHGKMSLAGALADARKTAARLYINNFSDKARQKTIDLLLGRLPSQIPVDLYDPVNDLVSSELGRRASEFTSKKSINIWAGTFNVNGRLQGPDIDLTSWLFPEANDQYPDPVIFAVGFQEIVELSPQQIMSTDPTTRRSWEIAVRDCLNSRATAKGSEKYVLLRTGQLVGAALMIYVREDALRDIKNVEGSVKKTGLSGIAGNKGGCAIRFEFSNTRLCFVTAHLAAGFANYDERNNDYETIDRGLRFQRNRAIEDHDTIVWLGDFNYRIGLGNQIVRDLVAQSNYQKLYDNDQLNLQMLAGRAFQFYNEGPVTFPPTYKYDVGTDTYDTSEKARIPAWCDRVLWKGSNIRQLNYNVTDLRLSDHRPVWAFFACMINIVDEGRKEILRQKIYAERRCPPHDLLADPPHQAGIGDGDLILFESISPGLPPPSSDHHKWWLDNSAPAKSLIRPPAEGYTLNPHRGSNPFSPRPSADWSLLPTWLADRNLQNMAVWASIGPQFHQEQRAPSQQRKLEPTSLGTKQNSAALRRAQTMPQNIDSTSSRGDTNLLRREIKPTPKLPPGHSASNSPAAQNLNAGYDLMDSSVNPPSQSTSSSSGDKRCDLLDENVNENIGWKPLIPQ